MALSEAEVERRLDKRIQERLATDRAYRNAESDAEAVRREEEIENEEIERAALLGWFDNE